MPSGEVLFHLDYLKVNVFQPFDEVLSFVESALLERAGLPLGGWIEKGPADRFEHILIGPGPLTLLAPKDNRITYTIVELKGEACAVIGAVAIQTFLASLLAGDWRWHGLRVDLAFDHVAFSPDVFMAAINAGDFNSRCLNIGDRDWNENIKGKTAYLGGRGQRKGRRVRVYDMRGYNRCEAELRGDWAKSAVRGLARLSVSEWPAFAIGHLRGVVDFVDRSADKRADRCPLLPWWADLVGDVQRIKNLPEEDRRKTFDDQRTTAIGKSESHFIRCARSLWPMLEAFGSDYFVGRIRHYAEKSGLTDEHRAFAEQLRAYRGSGLAGLHWDPSEGDDIPF